MGYKNLGIKLELVKTTEAALKNHSAVTEGSLYFTTDQNNLYGDFNGTRHCFNSIWFGTSLEELLKLPKMAEVLYWDTSVNTCYRYVNNTLTKVLTADNVESLAIEQVAKISDITKPSANKIYAVPSTDTFASNAYDLFAFINGAFVQVTPAKTNIEEIASTKVEESLLSLESELAAIRDDLKAGIIDDPSAYFARIEEFYTDTYRKAETLAKSDINKLVEDTEAGLAHKINTTQSLFSQKKVCESGEILLDPAVSLYEYDLAKGKVVSFNKTNLVGYEGVITLEILFHNAKQNKPTINPLPTWVDGEEPAYYNNTIIGFRSFDNGNNWIAYYQGGWD